MGNSVDKNTRVSTNVASKSMNVKTVKTVFLGRGGGVGKSSILIRFVKGEFDKYKVPTIGATFLTQSIPLDHVVVKFEIWDTAGPEKYSNLAPMYYRGSNVAVAVYDICNRDSLERAEKYIHEIQQNEGYHVVFALVGNKCDLTSQRAVSFNEGKELAQKNNCLFFETSAKNNINIKELFTAIAKEVIKQPKVVNHFKEMSTKIQRFGQEINPFAYKMNNIYNCIHGVLHDDGINQKQYNEYIEKIDHQCNGLDAMHKIFIALSELGNVRLTVFEYNLKTQQIKQIFDQNEYHYICNIPTLFIIKMGGLYYSSKSSIDKSNKNNNSISLREMRINQKFSNTNQVEEKKEFEQKSNNLQNENQKLIEGLLEENKVLKDEFDKIKMNETNLNEENIKLRNQNNILMQKNIKLQQRINYLDEEHKEMQCKLNELQNEYNEYKQQHKQLDLSRYREWSSNDLVLWILSLDIEFKQYENGLKVLFAEQQIDGSCLDHVIKSDITEWGIKNFKHRSFLYQEIANLKNDNKQQEIEGVGNDNTLLI